MDIVKYREYLKNLSRKLRNNSTKSENMLWEKIRRRKIKGFQFLRQKPIDRFIVDFYCKELKLVLEVDGSIHIGRELEDQERQAIIENLGISFLRFTNDEVNTNMSGVLEKIELWINDNHKK